MATQSRRWSVRNIALVVIVALIVVVAAGMVFVARSAAMDQVYRVAKPLVASEAELAVILPDYEEITFSAEDGTEIKGWFVPPPSAPEEPGPELILVHGFGNNREVWLSMADDLIAEGYGLLMIDLRGNGLSEGTMTTMGYYEVQDVEAAVDYVLTREEVDPERIALIGHSMGAATVVMAAPDIPEVKAVVEFSGFSRFDEVVAAGVKRMTGLPPFPFAPMILWFAEQETQLDVSSIRPVDSVDDVGRPMMFIHGETDQLVPLAHVYDLYEAAAEPKEIMTVPEGEHTDYVVDASDTTIAALIGFLNEYVK